MITLLIAIGVGYVLLNIVFSAMQTQDEKYKKKREEDKLRNMIHEEMRWHSSSKD